MALWQSHHSFMKQSSPDRRLMEKEVKEVTVEELKKLIQSQEGEFIIRVEPRKGDADGYTEPVST